MGSMALKEVDGPFIGGSGLEHNAGTGGAASIEVNGGSDAVGPWMKLDESAGAQQAAFFAIVDEDNDGIFGLRQRLQRSGSFDDRSYPDTIVGNAWSGGDRIVVSG
jgi:hypothetical protein